MKINKLLKKSYTIWITLLFLSLSFTTITGSQESLLIEIEKEMEQKTIISDGPINSPWPMFGHDTKHTGRSPYSTADNPYEEKWRFHFTGWLEDTPIIDKDGIIYCKGAYGYLDRYLYAIYHNGTEKWKFKTEGLILGSSPAIAEDGTIYIGCWDDRLYAINPNGNLKWRLNAQATIASSPAISDEGTIYFGTLGSNPTGHRIYAVNPDGTEKWHYTTGGPIYSDPTIGEDGTIYIGSNDKYLYAINPNGTLKWRFKNGAEVGSAPTIADDGTIYTAGAWDNYLYALYPNGTLKWKSNMKVNSNPSIDSDGIIYVGAYNLYAVYPNGTKKWTFNLGDERWIAGGCPAISAEGTIYIGTCIGETSGGEIIAVNPDGTEKWRKRIANKWVKSSPSIAEDGTIYIGSSYDTCEGYLYAFGKKDFEADAHGPYTGVVDEYIQFTGSASGGYTPYIWYWDFGDGNTSYSENPTHIYAQAGNYTVTLTVTDNVGNTSNDTTWANIQASNEPPNPPTIDGPTEGKAGESYDYTFTTTDPDCDDIRLYVDWGDDSVEEWIGPYNSGEEVTLSHIWDEKGTYEIKAKAKDIFDEESDWATLEVTIPRSKAVFDLFQSKFPILAKILTLIIKF